MSCDIFSRSLSSSDPNILSKMSDFASQSPCFMVIPSSNVRVTRALGARVLGGTNKYLYVSGVAIRRRVYDAPKLYRTFTNSGSFSAPGYMNSESDIRHSRIDTLEEVACRLASILLDPSEKDSQKRALEREKAYNGLIRILTSLVSMARAIEEYAAILEDGYGLGGGQKPPSDTTSCAVTPTGT